MRTALLLLAGIVFSLLAGFGAMFVMLLVWPAPMSQLLATGALVVGCVSFIFAWIVEAIFIGIYDAESAP